MNFQRETDNGIKENQSVPFSIARRNFAIEGEVEMDAKVDFKKTSSSVSRRGFIGGVAVAGALLAGGLSGCAPSGAKADGDAQDAESGQTVPENIAEELSCDIVVVGAGISGLAAAVQAGQNGSKVVLLEKAGSAGGNGMGTECLFAVGSHYQKEQGIEIDPVDVVAKELEESQYRVDGSLWMDMIENSASNIDWLEECGVGFNGTVDNYSPGGLYATAHWFEGECGAVGYVPAMQAAAEAKGVEIRFSTAASQLIVDDGKIAGLYAVCNDGSNIRIDCPAVILASGGIGGNKELLLKEGWSQNQLDEMMFQCVPSVEGDGYKMAMAVGAKDYISQCADQVFNAIRAFGSDTTAPYNSPLNGGFGLTSMGPCLWVNQEGDRFTPEDLGYINMAAQATACKGNSASYAIFDQELLNSCTQDPSDAEIAKAAFESDNSDSIVRADNISDLAKGFGIDPSILQGTVDRYNELCAKGVDTDFGKRSEFMQPLEKGPFYMAKMVNLLVVIDGGIMTNKRAEVLDANQRPIPGLYAVGLDGAMLWRNVYTQNMPGTQMGNNVNSGRNAANAAAEYISKA